MFFISRLRYRSLNSVDIDHNYYKSILVKIMIDAVTLCIKILLSSQERFYKLLLSCPALLPSRIRIFGEKPFLKKLYCSRLSFN